VIVVEYKDVVMNRSSIRSYIERQVEEEKIQYVLECARLAPSWVNSQCWRFIVVRDKELIQQIAKTTIVNRWIKNVPVIIIACADPSLSGVRNGINYYAVDVAIAMEHLILAATDVGLGTCWIAEYNETKLKELLRIPNRIKVVAISPLGYATESPGFTDRTRKFFTGGKKRKNLSEIVKYDQW
jgi:nitroreductase